MSNNIVLKHRDTNLNICQDFNKKMPIEFVLFMLFAGLRPKQVINPTKTELN